jgi:hypothetical protein
MVTTNNPEAVLVGLGVFNERGTSFSNQSAKPVYGGTEITEGSFSGYVSGSLTSGYVVVVALVDDDPVYYITPSKVALNTSMSLNLASMIQLPND